MKKLNCKIILICCLLSMVCLIMPAYHDFNSGWNKNEFYLFLGLLFVMISGLFFYAYHNVKSSYSFRKYGLASFSLLAIFILLSVSFTATSDIPTLGAMMLYLIVLSPILMMLELICAVLQRKKFL